MKLPLVVIALLAFLQSNSQNRCGFDSMRQNFLKTDPSYKEKEKNSDQVLYQHTIHPVQRDAQSVLTIPIVVHIIHQNGPENLSDAQVIAEIDDLNLRFQNAAPFYDATGTDIGIQFCLASVDPIGNPTTGITRDVSVQTDLSVPGTSDLAMKNVNRWDPHLYLNVWIMKNTGNGAVGGYATYPSFLGNGYDGIGIQYNVFSNNSVLAHEVGHYLGLKHTFEGNSCLNDNCMLDGDQVCDTPPDVSNDNSAICPTNSCSTEMNDTSGFNPFTSDVNELPNYMDYTTCSLSFTAGQGVRMNASLTQIRYDLLQSNGCGQHPGGAIPTASFTFAQTCGGTLLTNNSLNAVGAQWDFNGDGLIDDSGNSFTWNPPTTGTHTITMIAQGFGGQDTVIQTIFAQHYPYENYPMVNGFSGLNPDPGGFFSCAGTLIEFSGEPGMAHYLWSTGDTTQNLTYVQGNSDQAISLTTIDSAGLSWTTCHPVYVESRPAPILPTISVDPNDTLFCEGNTVDLMITYSPAWYSGTLNSSAGNIPNFHSTTYAATLGSFNMYSVYQVDSNGCPATSNIVTINALTSTIPQTIIPAGSALIYSPGSHFQWYMDGVPVPNSDNSFFQPQQTGCYTVFSWWSFAEACGTFALDTVCFVGLNENILSEHTIHIAPNPFSAETHLTFDKEQKSTQVKITDALGREVKTMQVSGKELRLDLRGQSSGMYFLRITDTKNNTITKKLLIQQ